jgi:hypothetical protein
MVIELVDNRFFNKLDLLEVFILGVFGLILENKVYWYKKDII